MKQVRVFALIAGLVALSTGTAVAGDEELIALSVDREATVARLLTKMNHCTPQEIQATACILGEGRVVEAVIPLMKVLHEGNENCRIAAALALSRIGEPRGTFAVKQAARFDESAKVRLTAAWFYETYVQPGSFAFVPEGSSAPSVAAEH
jgi:HEAT repeat protein